MDSKSKKPKKNQEKGEEKCDLDRLSSLPDCLLTHILSFLDTKSVVRTSVLSKRYKLLWTMSPCLDFRFSGSPNNDSALLYDGRVFSLGKSCSVTCFQSYVNHVLQFRENIPLRMFWLSLHRQVDLEFVKNCVDYAVKHKVQDLRIRGYVKENPIALPSLLLNSESLMSLHLHNAAHNCIELPKSVALPNLKVLRLKKFEFCDRSFNGGLFSGCPNLETLSLSKCSIRPVDKLKILDLNCLNLKNLEIKNWRSPWTCFDEHMIHVNAPRLSVFEFRGHLVRVNFKEVLPCLDNACIDLCYPTACHRVNAKERKQITSESFLDMLRHMCNVRFLSLSLQTIEVVGAVPDLRARAPIMFENLRVIKFTAENKYREKTIPIATVTRLLKRIATDVLIFDVSKEKLVLPESSKAISKKDAQHISIPVHVMRFLLESSPAAEFLCIEIPNLSAHQE